MGDRSPFTVAKPDHVCGIPYLSIYVIPILSFGILPVAEDAPV